MESRTRAVKLRSATLQEQLRIIPHELHSSVGCMHERIVLNSQLAPMPRNIATKSPPSDVNGSMHITSYWTESLLAGLKYILTCHDFPHRFPGNFILHHLTLTYYKQLIIYSCC